MANDYFNASGWPGTRAQGLSLPARSEMAAVAAAFDKLAPLAGNAGKFVRINDSATSQTVASFISETAAGVTIALAAGLVGTPSLSIAGDSNTGIYSPAPDAIGFTMGGAEVGRFTTVGLALGATSTNERLRVYSTDAQYAAKIENQRGDASGYGLWVDTRWNVATNVVARFSTNNGAADVLNLYGDRRAIFSGNVTIAAPTSGPALALNGATAASVNNSALQIQNDRIVTFLDSAGTTAAAGFLWYDSSNQMIIGQNNSSRIFINASGLGVNTAPSSAGLEASTGGISWFRIGAGSAAASFGTFFRGGAFGTAAAGYIGTDGGGIVGGGTGTGFGMRSEGDLILMSGSAERIRIHSGGAAQFHGFVGIGVNPSLPLHIDTTIGEMSRWNSTSAGGGFMRWQQGGVDMGYFGTGANLGVTTNDFTILAGVNKNLVLAAGNNPSASKMVMVDVNGCLIVNSNANGSIGAGNDRLAVVGNIGTNGTQFNVSPGANYEFVHRAAGGGFWFYTNGAVQVPFKIVSGAGTDTLQLTSAGVLVGGVPINVTRADTDLLYLNSTHASGGYIALQRGGVAHGYIGNSAALVSGGSTSDTTVRSQGNLDFAIGGTRQAQLSTTGTFNIVLAGGLRIAGHITRFESTEIATPSSSYADVATSHGGSRVPDVVRAVLRCKTTEFGYPVGSEVDLGSDQDGYGDQGIAIYASATSVGLIYKRTAAVPVAVRRGDTGVLANVTAANWRVVFRAIWL